MRLSVALSSGLLALPFDRVLPGATDGDPELSELVARLRAARGLLPSHSPMLGALDAVLIPVLLFARQHEVLGPHDASSVVAADVTDFLLLDLTPESYASIGAELGVLRWSRAAAPSVFPVSGVVWGANKRIMLPLHCRKGDREPVVLHMLLDTGSPSTLLCADSLRQLGFTESTPAQTMVVLHGCPTFVTCSHSHFADNDVLGADWLTIARARLSVDYGRMRATVDGSATDQLPP